MNNLNAEPTIVRLYGRILAQYLDFPEGNSLAETHKRNIFLVEGVEIDDFELVKTSYQMDKMFHNLNARVAIPNEIAEQMRLDVVPAAKEETGFDKPKVTKKPIWWGALEFEVDHPCSWEPPYYDRNPEPKGNRQAHMLMPNVPVSRAIYMPHEVIKLCAGQPQFSFEETYEWAKQGFDPDMVKPEEPVEGESCLSGEALNEAIQNSLTPTEEIISAGGVSTDEYC